MMTQKTLGFEVDKKLNRQQTLIVEAFKRGGGYATNVELSRIALRFGGRLHELKDMGFDHEISEIRKHGVRVYRMTTVPGWYDGE